MNKILNIINSEFGSRHCCIGCSIGSMREMSKIDGDIRYNVMDKISLNISEIISIFNPMINEIQTIKKQATKKMKSVIQSKEEI